MAYLKLLISIIAIKKILEYQYVKGLFYLASSWTGARTMQFFCEAKMGSKM